MTFGSSINHEWRRRRTLPTLGARPDSSGIGLANGRSLAPASLASLATLWAVQMIATRPDQLARIVAQRLLVQPNGHHLLVIGAPAAKAAKKNLRCS